MRNFVMKRNGNSYLVIKDFYDTLYGKQHNFDVKLPYAKTQPLICYTATTGMVETIGNIVDKNNAVGYLPTVSKKFKFKIFNPFEYKKGERVYITEHIRLDGKVEYIATKHKIAQGENNFLNIGFIEKNRNNIKIQVDIITGEHKWI